jgi:hypothetical protein
MDFHPDLYTELYRDTAGERIERQRLEERARQARRAAVGSAPRALVARALFRAATAVDSGEVWRVLWEQLARSEPAKSNGR